MSQLKPNWQYMNEHWERQLKLMPDEAAELESVNKNVRDRMFFLVWRESLVEYCYQKRAIISQSSPDLVHRRWHFGWVISDKVYEACENICTNWGERKVDTRICFVKKKRVHKASFCCQVLSIHLLLRIFILSGSLHPLKSTAEESKSSL